MPKRAAEADVIVIDDDVVDTAFEGAYEKMGTSVLTPVILAVMNKCPPCHNDIARRLADNAAAARVEDKKEVSDVYMLPRAANCGECWKGIGEKLGAIYMHIAAQDAGMSVEKMLESAAAPAAAPAETAAAAGAGAVEELS